MKVDSENNLILKNDLFTYTRRGLLVLSAAIFKAYKYGQLQWGYLLQFNKISLNLVFCSIKLAHGSAEWTDFEHKAAYFSFYDCTEKTVSFHPL